MTVEEWANRVEENYKRQASACSTFVCDDCPFYDPKKTTEPFESRCKFVTWKHIEEFHKRLMISKKLELI